MIDYGTYTAKVIGSPIHGLSPSTGSPLVEITFGITSPGHTGETIRRRLYFTDASAQYSFEALERCGWDGKDPEKLTGLGSVEVSIEVGPGQPTKDGKVYSEVKWINALGAKAVEGAERSEMMAKLRDLRAKTHPPEVASLDDFSGPTDNDDFPF